MPSSPYGPQVCSCSQRRSICRSLVVISPVCTAASPTPSGTSATAPAVSSTVHATSTPRWAQPGQFPAAARFRASAAAPNGV
jgi:hypothetical protein